MESGIVGNYGLAATVTVAQPWTSSGAEQDEAGPEKWVAVRAAGAGGVQHGQAARGRGASAAGADLLQLRLAQGLRLALAVRQRTVKIAHQSGRRLIRDTPQAGQHIARTALAGQPGQAFEFAARIVGAGWHGRLASRQGK